MNAYEIKTGLNRTKISHLMDADISELEKRLSLLKP